jgi:hypothetical protein
LFIFGATSVSRQLFSSDSAVCRRVYRKNWPHYYDFRYFYLFFFLSISIYCLDLSASINNVVWRSELPKAQIFNSAWNANIHPKNVISMLNIHIEFGRTRPLCDWCVVGIIIILLFSRIYFRLVPCCLLVLSFRATT